MTEREAFEAWAVRERFAVHRRGGEQYVNPATQHAWDGWQASWAVATARAAVTPSQSSDAWNALVRDTDGLGELGVAIKINAKVLMERQYQCGLAEKKALMGALDARDAAWPIKRAVGLRLQAVPPYQRQSYDVLWDAACRGIDDAIRSLTTTGDKA